MMAVPNLCGIQNGEVPLTHRTRTALQRCGQIRKRGAGVLQEVKGEFQNDLEQGK